MAPTVPLPESYSTLVRTAYCTEAEARGRGATGTTEDVMTYIGRASELVDRFTGELFVPTEMTVVSAVGGDGVALLPYRLSIDPEDAAAVVSTMDDVVLDPATYKTESSAYTGGRDAVLMGPTWVGFNLLVVGMEPYNDYRPPVRIKTHAVFGFVEPPLDVAMATAVLAAQESARAQAGGVEGTSPVQTADPEGNALPVVPPFVGTNDDAPELAEGTTSTTGSREADRLLIPYRRIRISAV